VRTITLGLVVAALAIGWQRRVALGGFVREVGRELALVEAVFLVTFLCFLGCRAMNPAIYWGEKPMDFAYLNAIVRSRTMPPVDPWFAGGTLNYFYFGPSLVAFFGELAGVPPELAFNLAIATVAGLLAIAACLVGRKISGTGLGGVAAAAAVVFLGNLDGVRLLYQDVHRYLDFQYYWDTSRVIDGTINEYPAWNLVFADLHAHVLAMPFEVTLAYLGLCWVRESGAEAPSRWTIGTLVALLLGAIGATSAWSVPTAVGLQAALQLTAWRSAEPRRLSGLVGAAVIWLAVVLFARLAFLPFWLHYTVPIGSGIGFETDRAPVLGVLTVFGVFWLALAPFAFRALGATPRLVVALAAALAVEIGLARSPAAGLFAATALVGIAAWIYEETFALRVIGLLVAVTGALGCGTEVFYVWDRMNTVFKYYLEAWLLLGCAAGAAFALCRPRSAAGRAVWWPIVGAAAAAGAVTTVTGTIGFLRSPIVASDTPTLDGMEYLRHSRPAELSSYRWLSRQVEGVPVMLEAHGDSYGEYARVSMNTGLPTVLGWEYHLFQQAHSIAEIHERRDDVRLLYSTTDAATGEALMRKYHVDLVFVGPLERRTYPAAGLAKFGAWGVTQPVFESGNVAIYARPGVVSSAKTWIEPVESGSSEAAPPLGSFAEPRDVARAPNGTIYVADFRNQRIQHLGGDLRPLGAFGTSGDAPGQFDDPCGIAVGPDGAVYVADTWNHRIQKFDAGGAFLVEWSARFYGPRGIAVDRAGKIYVADTGNRRVVRLSARGAVERAWGETELANPTSIAIDAQGEIYVADVDHRRVVVYDSDGRSLREWPVAAWNTTGGLEPYLEVGPDGVVWLTDPSSNRVLLFDGRGHPLGPAAHATALAKPLGIAVVDPTHAVVSNAGSHSLAVVWRTSSTSVSPER
jgi:YYY domain-containing protein